MDAPATTPAIPPAEATALYVWQQDRRRPDGAFAFPMSGFGPGGRLTLWLPAAVPAIRWKVRGGVPVQETVAAEIDPEAERLRRAVLAGSQSIGPGVVELEPAFYEYAAHVIRRNYALSDDDLEYVLFGGSRDWQREMIVHVLGGTDMVEALAGAAETRAFQRETGGAAFTARALIAAQADDGPVAGPDAYAGPPDAPASRTRGVAGKAFRRAWRWARSLVSRGRSRTRRA